MPTDARWTDSLDATTQAEHVTPTPTLRLEILARSVLLILLGASFVLILASLTVKVVHYQTDYRIPRILDKMVDLDQENNLPTWFSSANLALCAVLLFFAARAEAARDSPFRMHWLGLSLIFLYLSLDEAASIHEASVRPLQRLLGASGALFAAWVIPGAIAVTIVTLLYLRWLLSLPRQTKQHFTLAGSLFIGGALGMEMVSWHYRYPLHQRNPQDWEASKDLNYALITHVEEGLEILGVIVFIYGLLSYLAASGLTVAMRFADDR